MKMRLSYSSIFFVVTPKLLAAFALLKDKYFLQHAGIFRRDLYAFIELMGYRYVNGRWDSSNKFIMSHSPYILRTSCQLPEGIEPIKRGQSWFSCWVGRGYVNAYLLGYETKSISVTFKEV